MFRLALILVAITATACEPAHRTLPAPSDARTGHEGPGDRVLAGFLQERRPQYDAAIRNAQRWLDQQEVDPQVLRERGIKGKKKLTEVIDAYYQLWLIADEQERPRVASRLIDVSAPTRQSSFHDMARIDDVQFKQDSTSYLRAAYLLDRMGVDVEQYKVEIAAIHPRLNAHMVNRGPHQRHVFGTYYRHFGLEEPFPLHDALQKGYIARRANPHKFNNMDTYQLTHEVFAPYDFGEDLDATSFNDSEREYLRASLELLIDRYIAQDNADLVAELLSCMRMLRFVDSPQYRASIDFMLSAQHPDGSWGNLEMARRQFGDDADHAVVLHTTMVALDALTLVFHHAWNPS